MKGRTAAAIAIALLMSLALLAGCSSSTQQSDKLQRYVAYYEKCQEYITAYGSPSTASYGGSTQIASGLAFVRLLDMDADGAEELVLGYIASPDSHHANASGVEIWGYREGRLSPEFKGELSDATTNGGFRKITINNRPGGGHVIVEAKCHGSGPVSFAYTAWGYDSNRTVKALVGRAYREAFSSSEEITYYTCPNGAYGSFLDSNWFIASENEYEAVFEPYVGELAIESNLYTFTEDYGMSQNGDGESLSETIDVTNEVIDALADVAEGQGKEA